MNVDLIIGGASKSGTTAISEMLRTNPLFFLPQRKELHYFSLPYLKDLTAGPGDAAAIAQIPNTLSSYFYQFNDKRAGQVAVDVSPSYLFHHGAAKTIANDLPHAKVAFILRRPEEKIFSQYVHLVGEGRETLSFEDALAAETDRKAAGYSDMWLYTESGYYADAIAEFQSVLGASQVKVFLFDDFRRAPNEVLQELCRFIGFDGEQKFTTKLEANVSGEPRSVFLARLMGPNNFTNLLRQLLPTRLGQSARRVLRLANTSAKPQMVPDTRAALHSYYIDDIIRLESLIERETGWLKELTCEEILS